MPVSSTGYFDADAASSASAAQGAATPLGLRAAGKRFGGTVAIEDVSFDLTAGRGPGAARRERRRQEHLRQAAGRRLSARRGRRRARRRSPSTSHAPLDAQRHGVAVMHQHPGLFPDLERRREHLHRPHAATGVPACSTGRGMQAEAARPARHGGPRLRPRRRRCGRLRSSEQQLVEIARALSIQARVLIMDEPTAALSQREVDRLFARGRRPAPAGRGDDVRRPPDGGDLPRRRPRRRAARRPAGRRPRRSPRCSRDRAVSLMVGRPLGDMYPARDGRAGRGRARGRAAWRATARSRTSASTSGPARSLGFGGPRRQRPHRDRARAVRRRPADRRHDPARRPRGRLRGARRRHGGRASPMSRRTGSGRAWSWTSRSWPTPPCR